MVFMGTISANMALAQDNVRDTMKLVTMSEVEVISTRATSKTPVAFSNLKAKDFKRINLGQDLPFLMSFSPSAVSTSDAGSGIGYTSIRVRGTDASRINVTANGIPVNDAESHQVFWVNMPDFASSVKDMQIQRGAGTSTNGAGAFGASINLKTADLSFQPYTQIDASYGSFNTHKETFKIGTGLLNNHWTFDLRLSNIATDGFIDRASARLNSYYLQGAYLAEATTLKFIAFAGKEKTYHAWNYASPAQTAAFGRTFNSCGYMYITDKDGKIHQPNISYDEGVTEAKKLVDAGGTIHYYDNQTDNYVQKNYQLLFNHYIRPSLSLNIGLHYTKGDGFYQEYKEGRKLLAYGMTPYTVDGKTYKESDLIRQKNMDNHFGGAVFSLNYQKDRLQASVGGALNRYYGKHFGRVLWVKNYIGELDPEKNYYYNTGSKNDANIYFKANYELTNELSLYGDLQYRHILYKIQGENDKWNKSTQKLQELSVNETFDFFNPKVGLSYRPNVKNSFYASFSVAHKEPTRNNYTDGKLHERPRAERMFDYELGYNFNTAHFMAGVNLYYMDYKDQLVLTGEMNEIGEPLAANTPESYRMGIELMAKAKLNCGLEWEGNATFSKNRIKNFTETLYEWEDVGSEALNEYRGNTPIAFSPSFIFNNRLSYEKAGYEIAFLSQYVGKQYTSNAHREDQTLKAYFVSHLQLGYTFRLPKLKSVTVGCTVYNIFNTKYASNAYTGSGYYIDNGQKVRYTWSTYAQQAGTNVLGNISINF